jgi:hypothetical protein
MVAGWHRLGGSPSAPAANDFGPTQRAHLNDDHARLAEIDDNLCVAALGDAEQAANDFRRTQIRGPLT